MPLRQSAILTASDAIKYIDDVTIDLRKLGSNVAESAMVYKRDACIAWKKEADDLMIDISAAINSYKMIKVKARTVRNVVNELTDLKKEALRLYNAFDEMVRKAEKQMEEQNRNHTQKKYNVVEEMDWVFANLGNELIKDTDAPTQGSYYYLKKLQNNEDMMEDFYKMYLQRRMPSREDIDDMEKRNRETSDSDINYVKNKLDEALKVINNG